MKINWAEDWWLAAIPVAVIAGVAVSTYRQTTLKERVAQVVDLRAQAEPNDRAAPYVKTRKKDPDAVVLHQMGFRRGNDPTKYLGVTAHYIILPDGGIYQLYDHSINIPAAEGFNSRSVHIEFAGAFPSQAKSTDPKHFWFPEGEKGNPAYMHQLTQAQVRAGRSLLRRLKQQGIHYVFAHRQSTWKKGNGPGPDVWGSVGEYGVRRLGMSDGGPGYAIDSGKSIPTKWRQAYNLYGGAAVA